MIGREADINSFGVLTVDRERAVLRAEGLYAQELAHGVSFSLYAGEILGFYGLVGAGRSELARLLVGAESLEQGEIYIRGEAVQILSLIHI